MKRPFLLLIGLAVLLPCALLIWVKLPATITGFNEIRKGNRIIKNIDEFMKNNKLPDSYSWDTTWLKKIGFKIGYTNEVPQYSKISDSEYELIYVYGLDGPYLIWNSRERKWKEDFPIIDTSNAHPCAKENVSHSNQKDR